MWNSGQYTLLERNPRTVHKRALAPIWVQRLENTFCAPQGYRNLFYSRLSRKQTKPRNSAR